MTSNEIILLVKQCLEGQTESYNRIVRFFQGKIYRVCFQILGTPQDAEDATMEVFIKAYRCLNDYDTGYAFSTWLYRIAFNHSIGIIRRRKIETDYLSDCCTDPVHAIDMDCPESVFMKNYKQDSLDDAMETLPAHYRTALLLKYHEDLSYEQIGEIMDLPKNTVGSLILRGKKELRAILDETGTYSINSTTQYKYMGGVK